MVIHVETSSCFIPRIWLPFDFLFVFSLSHLLNWICILTNRLIFNDIPRYILMSLIFVHNIRAQSSRSFRMLHRNNLFVNYKFKSLLQSINTKNQFYYKKRKNLINIEKIFHISNFKFDLLFLIIQLYYLFRGFSWSLTHEPD